MLRKLIRYDLKYGVRMFLVLHLLMFAAALSGRFLILERIDFHAPVQTYFAPLMIFISAAILILFTIPFATLLLIAARFYKNLFTDEGYLTWTLPATPVQQLWAKIISGLFWLVLSTLLTYLAIYLLVSGENIQQLYIQHADDITNTLGIPLPTYVFMLLALSLFGTISSVLMIYSSISIGQLFPAHRLLCAVVTYFIFSSIVSIVSMTLMFAVKIFPGIELMTIHSTFAEDMKISIAVTIVISLVTAVVQYALTHYILTKKLNLN